jgi:hypothetical protein
MVAGVGQQVAEMQLNNWCQSNKTGLSFAAAADKQAQCLSPGKPFLAKSNISFNGPFLYMYVFE